LRVRSKIDNSTWFDTSIPSFVQGILEGDWNAIDGYEWVKGIILAEDLGGARTAMKGTESRAERGKV
jgi:hypothetical protein